MILLYLYLGILPRGTLRASLEDRVCDFLGNRGIPELENDESRRNPDHLPTPGIQSMEPEVAKKKIFSVPQQLYGLIGTLIKP